MADGHCNYCKRPFDQPGTSRAMTRDHVVPKSKGGTVTVHCCYACNQVKADMMPAEWEAFMAANPGWWILGPEDHRESWRRRGRETMAEWRAQGFMSASTAVLTRLGLLDPPSSPPSSASSS